MCVAVHRGCPFAALPHCPCCCCCLQGFPSKRRLPRSSAAKANKSCNASLMLGGQTAPTLQTGSGGQTLSRVSCWADAAACRLSTPATPFLPARLLPTCLLHPTLPGHMLVALALRYGKSHEANELLFLKRCELSQGSVRHLCSAGWRCVRGVLPAGVADLLSVPVAACIAYGSRGCRSLYYLTVWF